MATVNQRRARFISHKLKFLKEQADLLISTTGEYANKLISTGETWTELGDNKMEYSELCQIIETAVEFLSEKCEELTVGVAAHQLTLQSCGNHEAGSQSATATITASFYKQTTESRSETSHSSSTKPSHTAEDIQLTPVLARMAVIENAMSCMQRNLADANEQHSGLGQQLTELLTQLSDSDKKNNSKFRKLKKQVNEISDTRVTLDQEHETRLQSLENQLQKLSTAQDRMKVEMESEANLKENLVHVPDQLECVEENLDVLKTRIERIVDDCNNKHHDLENVTRDIADKVKDKTHTVNVISEGQDQKTTLLREMETRMQTLGADSERNVNDVRKQVEKAETNFRILCQMLNDRLTPLEQLRTCLNERANDKDENIRKLSQVIQEVAVMSPRLQQLELKSSRTRCGFTAGSGLTGLVAGDTLKEYQTPLSNVGGDFNADSGIFTAPVDGLYVASVSLYRRGDGLVTVSVRYKKQGQRQSLDKVVCQSSSTVIFTTACTMGVVDMKAGDTLSIYVDMGETSYTGIVEFSSFLLA